MEYLVYQYRETVRFTGISKNRNLQSPDQSSWLDLYRIKTFLEDNNTDFNLGWYKVHLLNDTYITLLL